MGMYTELILKCDLKDDIPEKSLRIIQNLFNPEGTCIDAECIEDLPNHPFFKCTRWSHIGNSSSYYHHPKAFSHLEKGLGFYLFTRSDLKNYDNEIENFLDWISPFIRESEDKCVGWKWYEEDDVPTLLIFDGKKINEPNNNVVNDLEHRIKFLEAENESLKWDLLSSKETSFRKTYK